MTRMTNAILLAGISAAALCSSAAMAQDAPAAPAEETADGEIIVTALRGSEALTKVPASITAFNADTIEKADIKTASDFVKLTPGVTIVTSTAEAGDTQINIRGINGARDAESSVALVVDGILKTNTAALDQNQGTTRQIEVLKGPQGALYGRNAAAGAIVVQTLKPGDHLEGAIEASYGNNNNATVNGYVAGPLSDNVGFVLSGDFRTTDGFYRNIYLNNKTVDDQLAWNLNGRLVADLGGSTKLDAKLKYGELHGASINFNASFHLPNFAGVNPAFYEDVNQHPFRYYSNIRPTNDQRTFEASLKLDHDFGPVTLTWWGLYSDIKNSLTADGTSADFARYIGAVNPAVNNVVTACQTSTAANTGFPVNQPGFIGTSPTPFIFDPANGSTFGPYSPTTCDGTQYQIRNQSDVSTELRIASNSTGPFKWQAGGYYLHIDRTVGVSLGGDSGAGVTKQLYNAPGSANPTSQLFADKFKTNVYAIFGSVEYKPVSSVTLGVALRYDIEERSDTNLVPLATDPFTGGPINPGQTGGPIPPQAQTFRQFEPKITARWEIAPNTNLFADWGVGFKSGGFNNQGAAAVVAQNFNDGVTPGTINANVVINDRYRKERSSAFEAGIKGKIGPVSYSAAGYYTKVRDMQFFEFFVGSFGLLRVVSNIDAVDLWGTELDLNWKVAHWWELSASGNFTDSEIKKNSSRTDTVGNKSPYTADYTVNIGSQWKVPVSHRLNLTARLDYRLTGPTWFHTVQNQTKPTLFSALLPISALGAPAFVGDATYDRAQRAAFGVFDLRVGLESERWHVTAFAKNLFDKAYVAEVIPAIEFGGSFISPGPRRIFGVQVGYKF